MPRASRSRQLIHELGFATALRGLLVPGPATRDPTAGAIVSSAFPGSWSRDRSGSPPPASLNACGATRTRSRARTPIPIRIRCARGIAGRRWRPSAPRRSRTARRGGTRGSFAPCSDGRSAPRTRTGRHRDARRHAARRPDTSREPGFTPRGPCAADRSRRTASSRSPPVGLQGAGDQLRRIAVGDLAPQRVLDPPQVVMALLAEGHVETVDVRRQRADRRRHDRARRQSRDDLVHVAALHAADLVEERAMVFRREVRREEPHGRQVQPSVGEHLQDDRESPRRARGADAVARPPSESLRTSVQYAEEASAALAAVQPAALDLAEVGEELDRHRAGGPAEVGHAREEGGIRERGRGGQQPRPSRLGAGGRDRIMRVHRHGQWDHAMWTQWVHVDS